MEKEKARKIVDNLENRAKQLFLRKAGWSKIIKSMLSEINNLKWVPENRPKWYPFQPAATPF